MTPTAFYCWLYEQPLFWTCLQRWQPRPGDNLPLRIAAIGPVIASVLALLTALTFRLLVHPNFMFLVWGALILFVSGAVFHTGFAVLAWNQRAARLRAGKLPANITPPARWLRWTLGPVYLLLIALVTPVAVLTGIENVRGAWAWRQTRAELVAKGERLTYNELLPTPVPADQNFASLPLFANLFDYTHPKRGAVTWRDTNAQRRFWVLNLPDNHLPDRKSGSGPISLADWAVAFRTSMSDRAANPSKPESNDAWQPAYVAASSNATPGRVVLTALSVADPLIRDVCEFSERPHARFPVHFEENFNALLPHLAAGKGISRHLALRVEARLAEGDAAGAFADQLCGLRVAGIFREEPLLISQLVRIAQAAIAGNALWPGIRQHQWTDVQLVEFQRRLTSGDYLKNMARSLEGERAGAIAMLDQMATTGHPNPMGLGADFAMSDEPAPALTRLLFPPGWIRQNETRIALFHQRMIEFGRNLATNLPPGGWSPALREFRGQMQASLSEVRSPHNMLYQMLVPALDKAIAKAARADQNAAMAATACALERHWKKHGAYPESLAALVPEFMPEAPRDLMDGQPLRYRRTDSGLFQLWSVGLDGTDNGGVAKVKDAGNTEIGLDWVWPN
jgi:hypothetical protein